MTQYERNLISALDSAFREIVEILNDNMPDCADEGYIKECWDRYDNAIDEFNSALEALK